MAKAFLLALQGGRQVQIVTDAPANRGNPNPGQRQKIGGFSPASRRRLMGVFSRLSRDATPLFLTLTYHETTPGGEESKRHLDRFFKRLDRYLSGISWSAIWRLEWQKRGVIHYHVMIWGIRFIPKSTVKRMWHEVTQETSEEHAGQGAFIEFLRSTRQAMVYVSKYLCKTSSDDQMPEVGRYWGIMRKQNLPWATRWTRIDMDYSSARKLQYRLYNEWGSSHAPGGGTTIFTNDPVDWIIKHIYNHEEQDDESINFVKLPEAIVRRLRSAVTNKRYSEGRQL